VQGKLWMCVLATAGTLAVGVSQAAASTVAVQEVSNRGFISAAVDIRAGAGESNLVNFEHSDNRAFFTVNDAAGLQPITPECRSLLPTKALCWTRLGEPLRLLEAPGSLGPPVSHLGIDLGDGDDETTSNWAAHTWILSSQSGGPGNDLLRGIGESFIRPGPGDDRVLGGPDSDTVHDEGDDSGSDLYDGGPDFDWLLYRDATLPLSITLDGIANDGRSGENDNIVNFTNILAGDGNDTLIGDDLLNSLNGATGDDRIEGRGGNDHLSGFDGNDVILGGTGNDQIEIAARGRVGGTDTVDAGEGDDQVFAFDDSGDADDIVCGPGNDAVFVDLLDQVAADCESVTINTR
jgi:Ca2+-binding RTX toxin-like protein